LLLPVPLCGEGAQRLRGQGRAAGPSHSRRIAIAVATLEAGGPVALHGAHREGLRRRSRLDLESCRPRIAAIACATANPLGTSVFVGDGTEHAVGGMPTSAVVVLNPGSDGAAGLLTGVEVVIAATTPTPALS
jgi:hypothetical protein